MSAPDRLSQMPLSAPAWVWIAYLFTVVVMGSCTGSLNGLFMCAAVAAFSFQFWVFAAWRGLRRAEAQQ